MLQARLVARPAPLQAGRNNWGLRAVRSSGSGPRHRRICWYGVPWAETSPSGRTRAIGRLGQLDDDATVTSLSLFLRPIVLRWVFVAPCGCLLHRLLEHSAPATSARALLPAGTGEKKRNAQLLHAPTCFLSRRARRENAEEACELSKGFFAAPLPPFPVYLVDSSRSPHPHFFMLLAR